MSTVTKICSVSTKKLPEEIIQNTKSFKTNFDFIKTENIEWIERQEAENNFAYKQIIPYVILQKSNGNLGCYQRHGSEKRLSGLFSCGFGGHIEEKDIGSDFTETLQNGMFRELQEEISNFKKESVELKYLGIINEIESNVGLAHLGLAFLARCKEDFIPAESAETKGLQWKTAEELKNVQTELWTTLALELM